MMNNIIKVQQGISGESQNTPRNVSGSALSEVFLMDESRMRGNAETVYFPENTGQVAWVMRLALEKNTPVTISGGRTGISGGAVPECGIVISTTEMKKIHGIFKGTNGFTVKCQAGVTLEELNLWLSTEKKTYFFPPDPTETGAALGGMAACNASGAHTFKYGPVRDYIEGLTAVFPGGGVAEIKRGELQASKTDNSFYIKKTDGSTEKAFAPLYRRPRTKNAAGYYSGPGIDLIDLFIGSEGTLGIITELELRIIPKPENVFNVMFFTDCEVAALELTRKLREKGAAKITAIEYFDPYSIELLKKRREEMGAAGGIPPGLPRKNGAAGIYIDVAVENGATAEAAENIANISQSLKNGEVLFSWAAFDSDERERLKKFRHALPETVNSIISRRRAEHPGLTKLGTDMAVPDRFLERIVSLYREKLEQNSLQYVIFGHIGNNHLHVNIIPESPAEYRLGKKLYMEFALEVVKMKGSVSAEHGIGKLKKNFLVLMLGGEGIDCMKKIKKAFDPSMLLGRGTLF